MKPQLHLRVNGITIDNLKIRRKMVSGSPVGERELVIEDPILGRFAIDDSFNIETTTDRRRKWQKTNVQSFLAILDSIECIS